MDKSKENLLYVSFDADSAGRLIGQAVMNDDPEEMSRISRNIEAGNSLFNRWVKERDGKQYSSGGDQGVYSIDAKYIKELEQLRIDYHYLTDLTVSIGIGKHLSESGQALLMAKLKGKNRIVFFNKETKKEIANLKRRAKKGALKTMEEIKLADAYMNKNEEIKPEQPIADDLVVEESCPYCEQTDGIDSDHCKLCHDAEVEDGEESCPFCQAEPAQGPKEPEIADEDCQFCKEKDAEEQDECPFCKEEPQSLVSPDSDDAFSIPGSKEEKEQYDTMGMNPPEIGKPQPGDTMPVGQNAPMDVVPEEDDAEMESPQPSGKEEPRMSIDAEDNHSRHALTAIAEQIEHDGNPMAGQVDNIDDTELAGGDEVEGNISRPAEYNQNVPGDMGMGGTNPPSDEHSQEEPDFSNVLEEGLNDHADSIKREKGIQMISQALTEFKACKHILENSRMESPELYQASISMLKAMIEMASMLGLGEEVTDHDDSGKQPQSAQTDSNLGQEQASLSPPQEEQNDEWNELFPVHPDHGGSPKPGHAPSAAQTNADGTGSVGQSIGKLSSKHTTKHIARNTTPPGAINGKGQQKVIDPKTGKTRWIDRKQGMVQSATGVPIKAPKRGENGSNV